MQRAYRQSPLVSWLSIHFYRVHKFRFLSLNFIYAMKLRSSSRFLVPNLGSLACLLPDLDWRKNGMLWKLLKKYLKYMIMSCQRVFMCMCHGPWKILKSRRQCRAPKLSSFYSLLPLCIYGNSSLGLKTFRHLMSAIKIALLECKYSLGNAQRTSIIYWKVLEKVQKSCNFHLNSFYFDFKFQNYNFDL